MAIDDDLGGRLGGRMTYLLKLAFLALESLHERHLEPFGITVRELAVLMLIAAHEPESQQQLASRLRIDRTSMVALLDSLERQQLVVRRPDEADRRRNVIELTEAGSRTLEDATAASDAAEAELLAQLDTAEAAQLRTLLARIGD